MRLTHRISAAVVLILALGAAGCGASSASGTSSAATNGPAPSAASSAAASAVDPNAAEQNPPGDIPDNQVFVYYRYRPGGYKVKVPEGWGRTSTGGAVTFTDKFNAVTLDSTSATTTPTVASVKATEVGKLQASVPGFQLQDVSQVGRADQTAVRIRYLADSPPDQVTGKSVTVAVERYEYQQGDTEAIVTLSGAKGADNVDPWRIVSDSLRWG